MDKLKKLLESVKSEKLAQEIDKSIIKIDDSLSVEDFALAVATVLTDNYGEHNYQKFLKILKDKL